MPTIVVEVMPKAELLDPQGKAVAAAIARLGHDRIPGVRIGKRFELTVDGPVDDVVLETVRRLADDLLSNQVIEDVVGIHVENDDAAGPAAAAPDAAGRLPAEPASESGAEFTGPDSLAGLEGRSGNAADAEVAP